MQECRLIISAGYSNFFYGSVNIASLILFVYMSVKFSRPLTGYWVEFLFSYRSQSLSQAIKTRKAPTDEIKARRYNEAAVRDADRQIAIMAALAYTT